MRPANQTWNQQQQEIITLHFYPVILLKIIYVTILLVSGHYGMNIFWTPTIFLFMEEEYYQDPIGNQISTSIFFGQILFIYLIHFVISMELLTLSLVPILLKPTNILLCAIGNLFSLLVLFSVLFHIFSLTSPFLQLLTFKRETALAHLYTTAFILHVFWFCYLL